MPGNICWTIYIYVGGVNSKSFSTKQNERRIKQPHSEFLSSILARKLLEHIPNLMFGICCITWKTTVVKSVVYTCLDIDIDEPLSCNIQLIMQTLITRVFFKKSISRRLSRKNRELSWMIQYSSKILLLKILHIFKLGYVKFTTLCCKKLNESIKRVITYRTLNK